MTPCARCGKDTRLRCSGCMDAHKYNEDEKETVYCNHECQLAHRPEHKIRCRARQQRKTLLRIATIGKTAILTYLQCAFDREFRSIKVRNGVLCIQEGRSFLGRHIAFLFTLTQNLEHKMAALTFRQYTTSIALTSTIYR